MSVHKNINSYAWFNPMKITAIKLTNKTKLINCTGMIGLNCENCGISYETQACWAKRVFNHFCSKSCHDEWREIKIKKSCINCGAGFIVNPTTYFKKKTCSIKCSNKIKSINCLKKGGANKEGIGLNNWLTNLLSNMQQSEGER